MGAIFNILSYSMGSLLVGVIITVLEIALVFFIIKSWYKQRSYTPLSFIVGGVLFLILAYHSVIICGATTIKSYGNDLEDAVNSVVHVMPDNYVFSQEETQGLLDVISNQLPLVGYYAKYADFHGHTPADVAHEMNMEMQRFMNRYIIEHLLWGLLFVVLGSAVIIRTMEGARKSRGSSRKHTRSKFYDE